MCDDDVGERLHSIWCRALKNIIFYMPVYFGKVVSYILKENEKCIVKFPKLQWYLTLLHSERPKLHGVLAILSAIGLKLNSLVLNAVKCLQDADDMANSVDPDQTAPLGAV